MNDQEAFDDLSFYTLSLGDAEFIHQHIVDAFAAQHVDEHSKPIKVAFAVGGLFLHHERGYSGRQVQLAHMALAPHKARLPVFVLPAFRGNLTIHDALQQPPGPERDAMIESVVSLRLGSLKRKPRPNCRMAQARSWHLGVDA